MSPISLRAIIQSLEGQDAILGMCLLGTGLVFMILGAHIFKCLVGVTFGFIGILFCSLFPIDVIFQIALGIVVGGILAAISAYFPKISVSVLAGGWTALLMAMLAMYFRVSDNMVLVLAMLSFAAAISFTFVIFEEMIAALMSFEGTLLFLSGLVIFLSHYSKVWGYFRSLMIDTPFFLGFVIVSGTVMGFYLQIAEMQKRRAGMSG